MTKPTSLLDKGEELPTTSWPMSSQHYQRRRPLSHTNSQAGLAPIDFSRRRGSNTWTSSSGDPSLLTEGDRVDKRHTYIKKYNQLAQIYGIRRIVPGDFPTNENTPQSDETRKPSWVHRAIRRTSSGRSTKTVNANIDEEQRLRRRRSISDVALNLVHHGRKDVKNLDLQALVRLSGKSLFFLPQGYAPGSLVLPTCLRAVAQYLVQHVDERGLFRVPGSIRVVTMLYEYYCADGDVDNISTTTRCPDLPVHIRCGPHDVASAFKKFLSGLPGGILGSLSTFDALVTVHSQLHFDPEYNQTKKTKLRARMIALAILAVPSQYQRDLICAVFGLLCLIGRTADISPREDEYGRPLPTANLMGYYALGVLFGPLLVNDIIDSYSMRQADPAAGLVLLPVSPPRSRKERHKHRHRHKQSSTQPEDDNLRNTHIANEIAEMIIVHWRDVVLQMRNVSKSIRHHTSDVHQGTDMSNGFKVGSSASHTRYSLREPPSPLRWDESGASYRHRNLSPETTTPTPLPKLTFSTKSYAHQPEPLSIKRQRSRPSSSGTSHKLPARPPASCLSPTVEESPSTGKAMTGVNHQKSRLKSRRSFETNRIPRDSPAGSPSKDQRMPHSPYGAVEYARSHGDLPNPHDRSKVHVSSSSDDVPQHNKISLHDIESPTIAGARNHDGHVPKSGDRRSRFAELLSPDEYPSNNPTSSAWSLVSDTQTQDASSNSAERREAHARVSAESLLSLPSTLNERHLTRCRAHRSLPGSPNMPEGEHERRIWLRERALQRRQQPEEPSTEKRGASEEHLLARVYRAINPSRRSRAEMSTENVPDEKRASIAQRSSSKPVGGAVKAIAALFKRSSPRGSTSDLPRSTGSLPVSRPGATSARHPNALGIIQGSGGPSETPRDSMSKLRALRSKTMSASKSDVPRSFEVIGRPSKDFWGPSSGMQPEKSTVNRRLAASAALSNASLASSSRPQPNTPTPGRGLPPLINQRDASPASSSFHPTPNDTPTRLPPISAHSAAGSYFASKKTLLASSSTDQTPQRDQNRDRDRDRDQPLSLGTMVPHREEPPVAQHISFPRPPSHGDGPSSSAADCYDGSSPPHQQRPVSGSNSVLHAQIRSLQRQLEARTEECAHLRRQLEARDDMDTGKLCERLREAQREARTWRTRAETAEKRVAVFERLTARVRGLRDAVVKEENGDGDGAAAAEMLGLAGDGQFDDLLFGVEGEESQGQGQGQGSSSDKEKNKNKSITLDEYSRQLCERMRQDMERYTVADHAAAAAGGPSRASGDVDESGGAVLNAENNYGLWTKPTGK
ncbi:hypothetical protein GGR53DRAFT_464840 [Hypoxylon sp. FL1150]|nr:hypothetical protein GGR53DRAFT_464840 [Hypoxylon sp. FL1150]